LYRQQAKKQDIDQYLDRLGLYLKQGFLFILTFCFSKKEKGVIVAKTCKA